MDTYVRLKVENLYVFLSVMVSFFRTFAKGCFMHSSPVISNLEMLIEAFWRGWYQWPSAMVKHSDLWRITWDRMPRRAGCLGMMRGSRGTYLPEIINHIMYSCAILRPDHSSNLWLLNCTWSLISPKQVCLYSECV